MTEKMPSSTRLGSPPMIARTRPYSSSVSLNLLRGLERFAQFTAEPALPVEKDHRGWLRWNDAGMKERRGRDFAMIFLNPGSVDRIVRHLQEKADQSALAKLSPLEGPPTSTPPVGSVAKHRLYDSTRDRNS